MTTWTRDECQSCQAPIIWCLTTSAKRMPVDYEPSPEGNIALRPGGMGPLAVVLGVAKRFGRTDLRTSHFSSCPQAGQWRKRGSQAVA